MKGRRFDQPSLIDAAFLAWGLAGYALIKLGGWLARVADDNLDIDFGSDE